MLGVLAFTGLVIGSFIFLFLFCYTFVEGTLDALDVKKEDRKKYWKEIFTLEQNKESKE